MWSMVYFSGFYDDDHDPKPTSPLDLFMSLQKEWFYWLSGRPSYIRLSITCCGSFSSRNSILNWLFDCASQTLYTIFWWVRTVRARPTRISRDITINQANNSDTYECIEWTRRERTKRADVCVHMDTHCMCMRHCD